MRSRLLLLATLSLAGCAPGVMTRRHANGDPIAQVRVLASARALDRQPHRVLDTIDVKLDVNPMGGPADARLRIAAAGMGGNAIVFDTIGQGPKARLRGVVVRLEQPFADARDVCFRPIAGVAPGMRVEACEREVAKDSLDVAAWRALAARRREAWDDRGERAALAHVVAITPRDAEAWYLLGRATTGRGNADEQLAAWRRAASLDSTYVAPRLALGTVLAGDRRRAAEALPWLDDAVRLGGRGEPLYWRGRALLQLERWQEAHDAFMAGADSGGIAITRAYAGAAYALSRAGRHAEAVATWDRVLQARSTWFDFAMREIDMIPGEKAAWKRSRKAIGR